jgi:hypothetical protein
MHLIVLVLDIENLNILLLTLKGGKEVDLKELIAKIDRRTC